MTLLVGNHSTTCYYCCYCFCARTLPVAATLLVSWFLVRLYMYATDVICNAMR